MIDAIQTRQLGVYAILFACVICFISAATSGAEVPVIENHKAITAGEHPRLIVRGDKQIKALQDELKTDMGKKVQARMEQALRLLPRLAVIGRSSELTREAGYHAAGYAALYTLTEEQTHATKAGQIAVNDVVNYKLMSRLTVSERAARLMGLTFAYDLGYDGWDEKTRRAVRGFMLKESTALLEKVGGVEAVRLHNETHAMVLGTAGLVELAVMGDAKDEGDAARLAAIEKSVVHYLNESVGKHGFGYAGESVKEAAFASGLLPFIQANALVTGRDLTGHASVKALRLPTLMTSIPGAGMPVVGQMTSAMDRAGLGVMSFDLADASDQPALAWLHQTTTNPLAVGVVRPHHGLYVLKSALMKTKAVPPGADRFANFVVSPEVGVAMFRTRENPEQDLVAYVHQGRIRLIGLKQRWITFAARDATRYSHHPSAARLDNQFGFASEWVRKVPVYQVKMNTTYDGFDADADAKRGYVRYTLSGEVVRQKAKAKYKTKSPETGKRIEYVDDIPIGGKFTGSRLVGVDLSGKSGAPAVMVVADTIKGGGDAPRHWVMHLGFTSGEDRIKVKGNTFSTTLGNHTLTGHMVHPTDGEFVTSSNPPYANYVHATTNSESTVVVLTLSRGVVPKVTSTGEGIAQTITVGDTKTHVHKDKIKFE